MSIYNLLMMEKPDSYLSSLLYIFFFNFMAVNWKGLDPGVHGWYTSEWLRSTCKFWCWQREDRWRNNTCICPSNLRWWILQWWSTPRHSFSLAVIILLQRLVSLWIVLLNLDHSRDCSNILGIKQEISWWARKHRIAQFYWTLGLRNRCHSARSRH